MTYVAMGPKRAARPLGLGATWAGTLSTNVGDLQFSMNVPYEAYAKQAIDLAVSQLKGQLPGIVTSVMPALKKEMPGLIDAAVPPLKSKLPELIKAAEPPLEDYINTRLWPKIIRPIVEDEIRGGTATIGTKAQKAGLIAGGTILAGVVAFLLLSGEKVQVTK